MVRFKKVWLQFIVVCFGFVMLTYLTFTSEYYYHHQHLAQNHVTGVCNCQKKTDTNTVTPNKLHLAQHTQGSRGNLKEFSPSKIPVLLPLEANKDATYIVYGQRRNTTGFLTIGIPSVKRPFGREYLQNTLASVINKTSNAEKSVTTVVVFLGDFDNEWNQETAQSTCALYKELCESGFLQIVQAPKTVYPNFTNLPTVQGETPERVKWRSKQNVDYALLMLYSREISEYYIQIEDDIECAINFISDIKTYVLSTKKWICIEFSGLGFIGKLFRSYHLSKVANHLLTFYDTLPCDLLLGYIFRILGQKKPIHYKYSLFQHTGKWSSLPKKMMPSIDRNFKDFGKNALKIAFVPKGDNPPAKIETTMNSSGESKPENAYMYSDVYFMATNVVRHSYYRLLYKYEMNFSRIIVSTGEYNTRKYALSAGELIVSYSSTCQNQVTLGRFIDGEFDTEILGMKLGNHIKCIIVMSQGAQNELMIRQISVFIEPKLQNLY